MNSKSGPTDPDTRARTDLDFIEKQLVSDGRIVPVGADPEERQNWILHDLASLIEGCFDEHVVPSMLDETASVAWQARLGAHYHFSSVESWDERLPRRGRRYWLLDEGERAGTIALGGAAFTGPWVHVSSLYVLPEHRKRGLATAVLDEAARHTTCRSLVGIRLGTSWTWQKSLRFYLDRGFWVRSWKHDIQLVLEPELPKRVFSMSGDAASLHVLDEGKQHLLLSAQRQGDRLVLETLTPSDRQDELDLYAMETFAMLLALAGWPLVRSEEHWAQRHHWSDMGEPEGLAYKIGVFEETAREAGWSVEALPIPGLAHWRGWACGERHGSREQQLRDLRTVLRSRGWELNRGLLDRVRQADPYFGFDQLLRRAVTAASLDDWLLELERA